MTYETPRRIVTKQIPKLTKSLLIFFRRGGMAMAEQRYLQDVDWELIVLT